MPARGGMGTVRVAQRAGLAPATTATLLASSRRPASSSAATTAGACAAPDTAAPGRLTTALATAGHNAKHREVVPKPAARVHTLPMAQPAPGGRPGHRAPSRGRPGREPAPGAERRRWREFCRHLAAERALSRHTVRAYQGDIQSLLEYAWRCGIGGPGRARPDHAAGLAGGAAPGGRRAGHAGPPGCGGPCLHRLRPPPGLARDRPGAAARHPQGPAGAAAGAAQGRDEPGARGLRGPGAARVRRGRARRRGPCHARRRGS